MKYRTLNDMDFWGKRVIVRVDFNVPVDGNGNVTDSKRIAQSIPTIKFLLEKNCRVVLATHMGRPDGKVAEKYRLTKIGEELARLIGAPVIKLDDCIGPEIKNRVASMRPREIILLENLRFYPQEEGNIEDFARQLAELADLYVNDAFGTCHRAHASVHAITKFLPAAAGFLLQKEIDIIGKAIEDPQHPFVAILGGAKVSDKIGVIDNLLKKADTILVGGAMANTFLKAIGYKMGASKAENEKLELAKSLNNKAAGKLILPSDVVCAHSLDSGETIFIDLRNSGLDDKMMALDIGPATIALFEEKLRNAKTIIWNGPLGYFEKETYNTATKQIAEFISNLPAISIIGGGDTAAAIEKYEFSKKLTHISTGGGASLEFIEGKSLPAIAALEENYAKFK